MFLPEFVGAQQLNAHDSILHVGFSEKLPEFAYFGLGCRSAQDFQIVPIDLPCNSIA
ncbi:MAG: hypothetical protein ACKO85_03835 [Isosphaeraceae bacterium]